MPRPAGTSQPDGRSPLRSSNGSLISSTFLFQFFVRRPATRGFAPLECILLFGGSFIGLGLGCCGLVDAVSMSTLQLAQRHAKPTSSRAVPARRIAHQAARVAYFETAVMRSLSAVTETNLPTLQAPGSTPTAATTTAGNASASVKSTARVVAAGVGAATASSPVQALGMAPAGGGNPSATPVAALRAMGVDCAAATSARAAAGTRVAAPPVYGAAVVVAETAPALLRTTVSRVTDDGTARVSAATPAVASFGGAAASVGISVDEDDVAAVPVSILKKKSTKRSDLIHFCNMRGISFHPAATKTRLVKLLTDYLVSVDVGQCGRARRLCSFLHGERERHPGLLLFQIPLGIPSKMEAPGADELASLAGLPPGTHGLPSVAGAPNAVLSTEEEHLVESLSAGSATAAAAFRTGLQARRERVSMTLQVGRVEAAVIGVKDRLDDVSRNIEDIRDITAFSAEEARRGSGKRQTDRELKYRARKRRALSAVDLVSRGAGADVTKVGAADSRDVAGAEDLSVNTFNMVPELIPEMPLGGKLQDRLELLKSWCHTEAAKPGLYGTMAVARSYSAWKSRMENAKKEDAVNTAATKKIDNAVVRAENCFRVVLWMRLVVPSVFQGLPARAVTQADAAVPLHGLMEDVYAAIAVLAAEIDAPLDSPLHQRSKVTYTHLRRALQAKSKKDKRQGEPKVAVAQNAAIRPWIEFCITAWPGRYGKPAVTILPGEK